MASIAAEANSDKVSFVKVAATAIKPSNTAHTPTQNTSNTQKNIIPSLARDSIKPVTPYDIRTHSSAAAKLKQPKQPPQHDSKDPEYQGQSAVQVFIHGVDGHAPASTSSPSFALVPSHAPNETQQHTTANTSTTRSGTAFADSRSLSELERRAAHSFREAAKMTTIGTSAKDASHIEDALLVPVLADEGATQVSSSDGSGKPPSLDGKSSVSGTTFAMDEKESLRPDDSASVKAAEDEDTFSPADSLPPGPRMGSDDGARAFRDQLREISVMEPSTRRTGTAPPFSMPVATASRGVLYVPPPHLGIGNISSPLRPASSLVNDPVDCQPDPKLLEALDSPRDRVWVLKLEQDIIDFVKDPKESSLNLPQCNSFYRMLAHKIGDYYLLGHLVDDSMSSVRLYKTPECRLPPPLTGITTPSTAASTPPPGGPQMKILRRGADGQGLSGLVGSNTASKAGSDSGDNENEPKTRAAQSREEREARYEAARFRIMGAAKPSELSELPREKEDSRSSSAAGKKKQRKQRTNSDDGFEARSAYNAYSTSSYTLHGLLSRPTQADGYPNVTYQPPPQYFPDSAQTHPSPMASYPPISQQPTSSPSWMAPNAQSTVDTTNWTQTQQPSYDLPSSFQQAMSFQTPGAINHRGLVQPPMAQYPAGYMQQQSWAAYPGNYPAAQSAFVHVPQPYMSRPTPPPSQQQHTQLYPYGQLPSQAYPCNNFSRNPEHPLPGSFNRNHFNPQSQTFVPGQTGPNVPRPYTPQRVPSGPTNFANPFQMPSLQRQTSAQSYTPPYVSSQQPPPPQNFPRIAGPPMTHPLPQPVFMQQPPLPAGLPSKPQATPHAPLPPQQATFNTVGAPGATSTEPVTVNGSTISKWAAPASLPAKPPPPAVGGSSGPQTVRRLT